MNEIRKYSKEWFTIQGQHNKSLEGLKSGVESKPSQMHSWIDASLFLGSEEDFKKNYEELANTPSQFPNTSLMNIKRYGAENIFKALDADGDGIVTQNEINDVAALTTSEFAESEDTAFTTEDLDLLYNNAMDAVNASLITEGNTTEFLYENGDSTKITKDDNGQALTKTVISHDENGNKVSSLYDYKNQNASITNYDAQGRVTKLVNDAKDDKKDYTSITEYADDGTKTVTKDEYTKKTTTVYGNDGKIASYDAKYKYESDGVIDDTRQLSIGDCWVLSGVNSLRETEKGRQMLKDSIQQNNDGSITVKLKGVGKEYTYSAEQIIDKQYQTESLSYSVGDTDMNLYEMAISDYRKELIETGHYTKNGRNLNRTAGDKATAQDPLNSGQIDEALYYITGIKSEFKSVLTKLDIPKVKDMVNTFNSDPERYAMTVSFKKEASEVGAIITKHAYNINSIDEDNVYVVNPHDSSIKIAYPKEEFFANVNQISIADLMPEKDFEPVHSIQQGSIELSEQPKQSKFKNFIKNIFK